MSTDLQWMVIRNCSSYLVKKRNIRKYFSTDPLNLKNVHSPRYSGMIHRKAIAIEPHPSGKGINLLYKKRKFQNKPVKNLAKIPLTKGARRSMTSIKKFVKANRYRRDLKMAALRRASAILRSQRPIVPKRNFHKKPE